MQSAFAVIGVIIGFVVLVWLDRNGLADFGHPWGDLFILAFMAGGLGVHTLIDRWVRRSLTEWTASGERSTDGDGSVPR